MRRGPRSWPGAAGGSTIRTWLIPPGPGRTSRLHAGAALAAERVAAIVAAAEETAAKLRARHRGARARADRRGPARAPTTAWAPPRRRRPRSWAWPRPRRRACARPGASRPRRLGPRPPTRRWGSWRGPRRAPSGIVAEARGASARRAASRPEAEERARGLLEDARATADGVRSEGLELVSNLREMSNSLRSNAERLLGDVQRVHSRLVAQIERVERAAGGQRSARIQRAEHRAAAPVGRVRDERGPDGDGRRPRPARPPARRRRARSAGVHPAGLAQAFTPARRNFPSDADANICSSWIRTPKAPSRSRRSCSPRRSCGSRSGGPSASTVAPTSALEIGGALRRVQVKWGRLSAARDVVIVSLRTSRCTPRGHLRSTYSEGEVDLFARLLRGARPLLPSARSTACGPHGRLPPSDALRATDSGHALTLPTTSHSTGL